MYTILLLSNSIKLKESIKILTNDKETILLLEKNRTQADEISKVYLINMFIVAADESVENINFIKEIKSEIIYKYTPIAYITSHTEIEILNDIIFCYKINLPLCESSFNVLKNIICHDMAFYMSVVNNDNYIVFNNTSMYLKLNAKAILFFEAFGHGSIVYTVDGSFNIPFTLKEIEMLINDSPFVRCHRSYIINTDNIYKIEKTNSVWEVFFCNCEKTAFISRNNKSNFISVLEKQLFKSVK